MSRSSGGKSGLQQGQFTFGPGQFDIQAILDAIGGNTQMTDARYNQLGLGGSTMQAQDDTQQHLLGQAAQGQLQESQVGNPAFNPALQTPTTNQQGTVIGSAVGSALGTGAKLLSAG